MAGVLPVGGSFVLPALPDATAPAVLGDVASGASALAPPPPPQAARQIEVNTVIVASALRAGVASVCWACFMVISPWVFVVVGPDAGEAGGDPDEAASAQDVAEGAMRCRRALCYGVRAIALACRVTQASQPRIRPSLHSFLHRPAGQAQAFGSFAGIASQPADTPGNSA